MNNLTFLVAVLLMHQGFHLLWYRPDKENHDSGDEQNRAHIGKSTLSYKGVKIAAASRQKLARRDRQKYLKWRVQRTDLENDYEKSDAVFNKAYVTMLSCRSVWIGI